MKKANAPVEITQSEYDWLWGLFAMRDVEREALKGMITFAAQDKRLKGDINPSDALRLRIGFNDQAEKKDRHEHGSYDEFLDVAQDSIPHLYHPVMKFKDREKRQNFASALDDVLGSIAEKGLKIVPDSKRLPIQRIYAPLMPKYQEDIEYQQQLGRLHHIFFTETVAVRQNIEDMKARDAKLRKYGIDPGLNPN